MRILSISMLRWKWFYIMTWYIVYEAIFTNVELLQIIYCLCKNYSFIICWLINNYVRAYLNKRIQKIQHSLWILKVKHYLLFQYQNIIHYFEVKVGASNEHSRYSLKLRSKSAQQELYSTFHIADWYCNNSYFGITCFQHFLD